MILARMSGGALGTVEVSKIAAGAEDELRVEIHGTKGALRFNGMDPHHLEAYDQTVPDQPMGGTRGWTKVDTGQRYPAPAAKFPSPKNAIGWMRGHMACLANFIKDLLDGRPGDPGLRQGVYIQHVLDRAAESATTGTWVKV